MSFSGRRKELSEIVDTKSYIRPCVGEIDKFFDQCAIGGDSVSVRGMPSEEINWKECVIGVGIRSESNIPIS